jgi:hypothetical protein
MDEVSASDMHHAVSMAAALPDQKLSAFGTAAVAAIASAVSGDAKDCACDVCISLRGLFIGIEAHV